MAISRGCGIWVWLPPVVLICASTASGQGPAPETAPPLFPGGGLVSYNSAFTTRGPVPAVSGDIPATARPTFAHEGDFNFMWGFYRDLDLTILVPIVTNQFGATSALELHNSFESISSKGGLMNRNKRAPLLL